MTDLDLVFKRLEGWLDEPLSEALRAAFVNVVRARVGTPA